jgi:hypothetical protein
LHQSARGVGAGQVRAQVLDGRTFGAQLLDKGVGSPMLLSVVRGPSKDQYGGTVGSPDGG